MCTKHSILPLKKYNCQPRREPFFLFFFYPNHSFSTKISSLAAKGCVSPCHRYLCCVPFLLFGIYPFTRLYFRRLRPGSASSVKYPQSFLPQWVPVKMDRELIEKERRTVGFSLVCFSAMVTCTSVFFHM